MDGSTVGTHGLTLDELRADGLRLYEAVHQPSLCIPQHEHEFVKVCVLLRGSFTERDGLDLRSLRPKDILVRASRRSHTNHYGGRGARSLILEVPPDHPTVAGLNRVDINCAARGQVVRAAVQLVSAFYDCSADRPSTTRAAMRRMLASIVERGKRGNRPIWLDAVREHLNARFAEPLSLHSLADYAGVHPVHLSQSFHAHFGRTLTAYLRSVRVFHATELLRSGAQISTIAISCGFCDQCHFTRAFHREHQSAPGHYRKAMIALGYRP